MDAVDIAREVEWTFFVAFLDQRHADRAIEPHNVRDTTGEQHERTDLHLSTGLHGDRTDGGASCTRISSAIAFAAESIDALGALQTSVTFIVQATSSLSTCSVDQLASLGKAQ